MRVVRQRTTDRFVWESHEASDGTGLRSVSLCFCAWLSILSLDSGEQEVLPHIPTGDVWREDKDSQCPPLLASVLWLFQHQLEKKIHIFIFIFYIFIYIFLWRRVLSPRSIWNIADGRQDYSKVFQIEMCFAGCFFEQEKKILRELTPPPNQMRVL